MFFAVAMALVSLASSAQDLKANMDPSVKPGDDFWLYAVGGWLKANPLDKQHAENGAFTDLEELNNDRIKELIMKYAEKQLPQGTDGQKIGALYRLYMDSVSRNKMGYEPIKPYLKQVREVKTREELLKLMCDFDAKGFNTAPFGIGLSLNPFNSSEYMIGGGHGGASLPQEYYANPNEQQKKTVEAKKALFKDFFKMVGYSDKEAQKKMEAEWAIEHAIGIKTLNQVESRNPMATIHIMPWQQLLNDFKGIDWEGYRDALGMPKDIDQVNISQLEPLHEVEWKRAVATISGSLGETIGKLYVQEYFPESSKQRVVRLVKDLQQAFEDRLNENTWMSDSTKAKALEKLHAMHINVGYPDKWEDMEKFVDIRENENLVENFIRITQEARAAMFRKYWHQPVDKTRMVCTPQTVNAFYHPLFNSINFPAAILQPPFFDVNADYASNYGAIGVVMGHEMTHGFDDQGCQFDKDGNLKNWWTADDKTNYDQRTKVIADWFSEQEAVPGLKVNGQKTLGENVSDNGGLKIAYRAYENRMKQEPLSNIEGFTPAQRFYLAYARVWACNSTPEYTAMLVNSDVHSPARIRVMAALPMIDTWYDAFGIKQGDKMFIPKEKRALVW